MDLYFLESSIPLTKTYDLIDGEIIKTPYPFVWEFTSHLETCTDLKTFAKLLERHAAKGHCLIKGELQRALVNESRAGSTDSNSTTQWLCLDLDGLPEIHPVTQRPMTVDQFLSDMGLVDISYIVQYSASHGIVDKKLRAHVYMFLDKPYPAPLLKQWLIQKNHEVLILRDSMELTKTANAIRWPLDISACQNDKLLYIAPPIVKNKSLNTFTGKRIQLFNRQFDVLALSSSITSAEKNKAATHARINELREATGIAKRKFSYRIAGGTEVLLKPDESTITEMKIERGFVYFNLNGGDSWAYYHPEEKPDYIFNFKGEPAYLTKELLPDYWATLQDQGSMRISSSGILYLAFCDRATGTYWKGSYDTANDVLDITQAKNETQIRHFAKQYGVPLGDYVPEWDLVFDPHDAVRVDTVNRTVNRFQRSKYMKSSVTRVDSCPSTIFKVMHHALGSDVDVTEHFINWTAFILQARDRTKTAWVMHGDQGTGKGILTNNILRPIFAPHTTSRRMEELSEKYNHFMQDSLLVFVDEVQIKALQGSTSVMAKLKNFITEEYVPIRAMHANALEVRNFTNWIFMSNMADPVSVAKGDRRMNIARYQPNRLIITDAELAQIEKELQSFHDYLMSYPVDAEKARTIIQTKDRDDLISISESSIDTVSSALLEGHFEFFLDQLPTDNSYQRNAMQANRVEEYTLILKNLMIRTKGGGKCNISREELRTIYDYVIGNIPVSPNKFTSLLKHHRVHISRVWVEDKTVAGVATTWKDYDQFGMYTKIHWPVSASKLNKR